VTDAERRDAETNWHRTITDRAILRAAKERHMTARLTGLTPDDPTDAEKARFPPLMTALQCLAWMVWRRIDAVEAFNGPDARELWQRAKDGLRMPFEKPRAKRLMDPAEAEAMLRRAIATGELRSMVEAPTSNARH